MTATKRITALLLAAVMLLALAACGNVAGNKEAAGPAETTGAIGSAEATAEEPEAEKNGGVCILYTSDVHCGIDRGFGYAGLQQIRSSLEAQGYATLLVDDGDAIQGEAIGTVTRGEAMVGLMNAVGYDVAIPGNHEFDYGMDRFLSLAEQADFPYISCNFNREGELLFPPYVIKEAAGMKIGFVGVTTPETLTTSTPKYFQNEEGEYIYGFLQDADGSALYEAVQKAVDGARADGADYVYVMGHLGNEAECSPWTYADVISHTSGIDVFFDGHSHDTDQVVMKNKDGQDVVRTACGTKLSGIGYSFISPEEGITDTDIWTWNNEIAAPELLNIRNGAREKVDEALAELEEQMGGVIAHSSVTLTINDPEARDEAGNPIRIIRRAETNLGDFCADAFRQQSGADIALIGGGGIRVDLEKGDVTYADILRVNPFGNYLCVIEATGQQILDALEWGVKAAPEQFGCFLQVSGLTYEFDVSVPSGCTEDENSMMSGIEGARRVSGVTVGGQPLDPAKTYTVAGTNYTLLNNGDGLTAFDGAPVLQDGVKLDSQVLIDYISEALGGEIGAEYADPYGQGRIRSLNGTE